MFIFVRYSLRKNLAFLLHHHFCDAPSRWSGSAPTVSRSSFFCMTAVLPSKSLILFTIGTNNFHTYQLKRCQTRSLIIGPCFRTECMLELFFWLRLIFAAFLFNYSLIFKPDLNIHNHFCKDSCLELLVTE